MRVLVTGGLGFLGNAVTVKLAAEGHTPIVLTSRHGVQSRVAGIETVTSDIRDAPMLTDIVRRLEPDGVCHLAAVTRVRESFTDPLRYFDVNLGGTIALLRAVEDRQLPIVFVSTGAVYGPCEGQITEDQPTLPTNAYGASKLAAEQLLVHQAKAGKIGATILRCFNMSGAVGGVGDSDLTRIIPKALEVAAGRASHIDINGDGSVIREFSHIADVAAAVVLALRKMTVGQAGLYNVGSGVQRTMSSVIQAVESVTGRSVATKHHPPKPEPAVLVSDSSRFRSDVGWAPAVQELEPMIADAWSVSGTSS